MTLGKPIENVSIYVLDKELYPVPAGEVGEIYIGGAGVGRGYRNRPELTERVFLDDPFSKLPGARMYKTGDLGRLLPDGRLDFQGTGRQPSQIAGLPHRARGNRGGNPQFRRCSRGVVQVVDYGADDQHLVAYFFADKHVAAAELREALRQRLPYYMLPSELIPLESLPMTINGKVDRGALDGIRIAFETEALQESTLPPSDDLEAKLQAIWQKLLKVRHCRPKRRFLRYGRPLASGHPDVCRD